MGNVEYMGTTIMHKFCALQRLKGQRGLACALEQKEKVIQGTKFEMAREAYDEILWFFQKSMRDLRLYYNVPHPINSKILSNCAK